MARMVLSPYAGDMQRPMLGRVLATAISAEGASWAEVTQIVGGGAGSLQAAVPEAGCALDVQAGAAMQLMLTPDAVAGGAAEQGYTIAAGQGVRLYMRKGDRIFTRSA